MNKIERILVLSIIAVFFAPLLLAQTAMVKLDGEVSVPDCPEWVHDAVFYQIYPQTYYDSDGDGITDSKDSCPETMSGVKVDPFECPEDSDKDGIPDYEDKCPNTPRNILIDNYGCPIDSDRDGIPDYLDKILTTI